MHSISLLRLSKIGSVSPSTLFLSFFLSFFEHCWEIESPCVRAIQGPHHLQSILKAVTAWGWKDRGFCLLAWNTNQWIINRNKKKSNFQSSPLKKLNVDSVSGSTFGCRLEPSYCCSQEPPSTVTAAEGFPWELCFPLTFLASYSHQALRWSGGRMRKTTVKVSMLSFALSEAAWEPAEGGTSVI